MHVNCTNNTYMVQCCCMAWRKEPFEEHLVKAKSLPVSHFIQSIWILGSLLRSWQLASPRSWELSGSYPISPIVTGQRGRRVMYHVI